MLVTTQLNNYNSTGNAKIQTQYFKYFMRSKVEKYNEVKKDD